LPTAPPESSALEMHTHIVSLSLTYSVMLPTQLSLFTSHTHAAITGCTINGWGTSMWSRFRRAAVAHVSVTPQLCSNASSCNELWKQSGLELLANSSTNHWLGSTLASLSSHSSIPFFVVDLYNVPHSLWMDSYYKRLSTEMA
jgi:hypothetical protein